MFRSRTTVCTAEKFFSVRLKTDNVQKLTYCQDLSSYMHYKEKSTTEKQSILCINNSMVFIEQQLFESCTIPLTYCLPPEREAYVHTLTHTL